MRNIWTLCILLQNTMHSTSEHYTFYFRNTMHSTSEHYTFYLGTLCILLHLRTLCILLLNTWWQNTYIVFSNRTPWTHGHFVTLIERIWCVLSYKIECIVFYGTASLLTELWKFIYKECTKHEFHIHVYILRINKIWNSSN